MEWRHGEYIINDGNDLVDFGAVISMLSESYWAKNRPAERTVAAIKHSLCFNLFLGDAQVGFARVVTDQATFAWICDVIIHPDHRGQGLGSWLMSCIDERLSGLDVQQLLKTRDAHTFYESFGFNRSECMSKPSQSWLMARGLID
jgi:GNAT superfamily N-acetyltransferase